MMHPPTQINSDTSERKLHPAFAGIAHDGYLNERDALAVIMKMITEGSLTPVFQENNMNMALLGVKRGRRDTKTAYEEEIRGFLFSNEQEEISTNDVGKLIKSGQIQKIIKDNSIVIKKSTTSIQIVKSYLGKLLIGTEKFTRLYTWRNILKDKWFRLLFKGMIIYPLTIFLFFLLLDIMITGSFSIKDDNQRFFLVSGLAFPLVFGFMFIPFFAKQVISSITIIKLDPDLIQKYQELYEFIKKHPLPPHRITNEYLSFAIAFGLDNSWQKDFST